MKKMFGKTSRMNGNQQKINRYCSKSDSTTLVSVTNTNIYCFTEYTVHIVNNTKQTSHRLCIL